MKLNVLACEKNRKLSSNRPQGTLVLKISHFKITGCGNTGLYTWAGCCATVALKACSNQIRWQANLVFKTKTDTFALHCEHICFWLDLYCTWIRSHLCLQCSFCHHSVFSFDGRWCQCFTCFWCFLSNILVSIQFYLFSSLKKSGAGFSLDQTVSSPADVVFFIYLYQRWIYRVDPNRVNEFGTSGVDHAQNNTAAPAPDAASAAITDKPEGEKKND